jgi:hypothetical protein
MSRGVPIWGNKNWGNESTGGETTRCMDGR